MRRRRPSAWLRKRWKRERGFAHGTEAGSGGRRYPAGERRLAAPGQAYLSNLAIPLWSLGQLLDLAEQLAAIKQTLKPSVSNKVVVTMAGDHGVVDEGVSTCPREVTSQMVYNFVAGGAGINAIAGAAGARVVVVDMGVAADLDQLARQGKIISRKIGRGTGNMARGPAMTREQAVQALEAGHRCCRTACPGGGGTAGNGRYGDRQHHSQQRRAGGSDRPACPGGDRQGNRYR